MPVPSACLNNSGDQPWKPKPKKPSFTYASDKRVVTSVNAVPKNTVSLPEEMMIVMEQALEIGVPVQVQFEITPENKLAWSENDPAFPDAPGFYAYLAKIKSVKARVKPGTDEFVGKEELSLNHVINGTEGSAEFEDRAKKRMQKAKEKDTLNRFTGLEL